MQRAFFFEGEEEAGSLHLEAIVAKYDLPISQTIIAAVETMKGEPVVKMPTLSGSVPFYILTDILHAAAIGVPMVNHDNNQHSANENLRLQNLWDGIEVLAALMTM